MINNNIPEETRMTKEQKGVLQDEADWCMKHKDNSAAKYFLQLANLYMSSQDQPTYSLLMVAAEHVREEMRKKEGDA